MHTTPSKHTTTLTLTRDSMTSVGIAVLVQLASPPGIQEYRTREPHYRTMHHIALHMLRMLHTARYAKTTCRFAHKHTHRQHGNRVSGDARPLIPSIARSRTARICSRAHHTQ